MAVHGSPTDIGSVPTGAQSAWAQFQAGIADDREEESQAVVESAPAVPAVKPRPGTPDYFIYLLSRVGCTPEDVVGTVVRNMNAKKVTFDSEGNSYEIDDGPTQVNAAAILLKGMRILTGGDVNVFTQTEGAPPTIQFGGPDLASDPEEEDDPSIIEGELVRRAG